MRTALLTVAILLALAGHAAAGGPASAVRAASEAETHEIAVHVRQPRWTCFRGLVARRGGWAALRRLPGGGCPELPYAIVVREDRAEPAAGWRELRRFSARRAACTATRPRLSRALRAGLLGCGGSAASGYSADSSHQ
ncbi:hypothetical protein [Conexibacter woesei]|uniref:Histone-lysine N-methyltransferase n=1 Tax=Conexibacter woesei (strain DSM 14684 / CCUG 47730 / CIP 108061 / JCM 11494 / NBRC 100937 / ID131577) TaxID=469383 RepID=D3F1F6_CONWI|nr:hypothetical protein [Conexibacter woesei]ADB52119.1 histone-lysine N-methyltransferase [Conexibacter woesei DSM 14684]